MKDAGFSTDFSALTIESAPNQSVNCAISP